MKCLKYKLSFTDRGFLKLFAETIDTCIYAETKAIFVLFVTNQKDWRAEAKSLRKEMSLLQSLIRIQACHNGSAMWFSFYYH